MSISSSSAASAARCTEYRSSLSISTSAAVSKSPTSDCLSEVAGLGSFENVLRHSETRRIYNSEFRLLTLDALITAKEAAGREKDLAAVRQLRAIKERNEQRNN